jgi:two-component system nitrogen regulation response regulator GlnG
VRSVRARAAGGPQGAAFERRVRAWLPVLVAELSGAGRPLYRGILGRVERPLLRHVLEVAGGNQLRAAQLLGINRNTLRKRLRAQGLLPPHRPPGP